MAAQLASPASPVRGTDLASLGEVALALMLAVVTIVLLAWLLRRLQRGTAAPGVGRLRVVGTLALGPRERLVVVDAAGTQILLGVAPGGISRLHEFPETVFESESPGSDFASRLRQALARPGAS